MTPLNIQHEAPPAVRERINKSALEHAARMALIVLQVMKDGQIFLPVSAAQVIGEIERALLLANPNDGLVASLRK